MILVDTSAWIDFFRGRGSAAARVDEALAENVLATCGPVLAELRRGFKSASERTQVLDLLRGCHLLEQPADLWTAAGDLGFALRRRGSTVKTMDLLIASYALAHDVELLTGDHDFDPFVRLAGLRVVQTSESG